MFVRYHVPAGCCILIGCVMVDHDNPPRIPRGASELGINKTLPSIDLILTLCYRDNLTTEHNYP